jgi:hypothetical protein
MISLKRDKLVKQYQDIINLAMLRRLGEVSWRFGSAKTMLAVRTAQDRMVLPWLEQVPSRELIEKGGLGGQSGLRRSCSRPSSLVLTNSGL